MSSQDTVTDGDARRLLQLLDVAREQPDDAWSFPPTVLAGLRALIPCTEVLFQLAEPQRCEHVGGVLLDGADLLRPMSAELFPAGRQAQFWSAFWAEGGCCHPQRTGDYRTVLRRSDRSSDRAYALTAMGRYMRERGVRHEVAVPLPPQGPVDRRLVLFRHEGPDFTEREVLLLTLFRPHLIELHHDQQRRLRRKPTLTPRQWEVLRLAADGASNIRIARVLGMSEATARKHLQNAYARLGVASRTEAVAKIAPFLDHERW